ncbi:MAG: hypothetical protein ALECFALPRED_005722 [Alectoria fallacina]|uniref:Uncharacterized protein n=1 Tax=Alectoria fallacina TaxID=1903189 RepID=A0A8H3ESI5_9LECA|nr:MAG: hypothetical protein ALECFALPRED_005722 [Alectoria fallacina]
MAVGWFYKWEDHNHGLEHKCGTCATVLSSPRAKKTCFGVHEEVCPAYHKTLHYVGASHRCEACKNTIKAHDKRHHEIAEIAQIIHRLEGSSGTDSLLHNNKRKAKKRGESNPDPSNNDSVHVGGEFDQDREVETDNNSSTLNNDDDNERKQCWSGAMENADARKAAKAERKSAKNQVLFNVISQEDLAIVQRALHPESEQQSSTVSNGQGLADNRTIDENIAFNANTFKWGKLRQGVHAKKTAKNNGRKQKPNTPQQDNEILGPILVSLGINTRLSKAGKERKSLDAKLRAAILGDLVAFENDQVETMQRMAGYWRYANRRTYNEMVRNNELWDWATGEKLPEIREEVELDVIQEEDENAEAGTLDGQTEGQIPEHWDDPDFELPAGLTALSLTSPADSSNIIGAVSESDVHAERWHANPDTKLDEEIETNRDRIMSTHISKLSFNLGRLPGQTSSFEVLSPVPSYEDWERCQDESGDHAKEGSNALYGSPAPRIPLSPMTSNSKGPRERGFQGVKDTRVFEKATRQASPPFKDTPQAPRPTKKLLVPATQKGYTPDLLNRFGALDHETPAPCEEVKKEDPPLAKSVVKVPAKPIVKTLTIHDEQDDWTTLKRAKGKKGAKGGPAVALREGGAVNVHVKKFAGGKTFAAVVKKGM